MQTERNNLLKPVIEVYKLLYNVVQFIEVQMGDTTCDELKQNHVGCI